MNGENYLEKFHHLRALSGKLTLELPETLREFGQLHSATLKDGALSRKVKELMALAVSMSSHCEGCIAYHVHDALKAGASRGEVLETIGLVIMMGGGPGLVYGCEALEALNEFETQQKAAFDQEHFYSAE